MNRLLTSLLVITVIMASCCCYAAGAYGHFIIANRAIDGIMSGKQTVPDEL